MLPALTHTPFPLPPQDPSAQRQTSHLPVSHTSPVQDCQRMRLVHHADTLCSGMFVCMKGMCLHAGSYGEAHKPGDCSCFPLLQWCSGITHALPCPPHQPLPDRSFLPSSLSTSSSYVSVHILSCLCPFPPAVSLPLNFPFLFIFPFNFTVLLHLSLSFLPS